ncbi:12054_t:CDS:1 [Funneliformis mosseae]|uniref:Phosphatidylglycerol/phosphatidylinositol transfer protein n=1 Tax=Funneliformis mosseae TaxID=27381 RepID=A0A9N9CXF8_FUNMO|nr:12054_t:CDS:1 [Funneliformis mosseae]
MVNAIPHKLLKRTSFNACFTPGASSAPALLQVSISPDPPVAGTNVKVSVSGTFSKDVTAQTKLVVAFADFSKQPIAPPFVTDACTGSGCPIKAGDSYSQSVDVLVPNNLPSNYIMGAGVGNSESDILGCAYAIINEFTSLFF